MLLNASLSTSREETTRLAKDLAIAAGSTFVMVPDTGPGAWTKRNLGCWCLRLWPWFSVLRLGSCGDAHGKQGYKTVKGWLHILFVFFFALRKGSFFEKERWSTVRVCLVEDVYRVFLRLKELYFCRRKHDDRVGQGWIEVWPGRWRRKEKWIRVCGMKWKRKRWARRKEKADGPSIHRSLWQSEFIQGRKEWLERNNSGENQLFASRTTKGVSARMARRRTSQNNECFQNQSALSFFFLPLVQLLVMTYGARTIVVVI